MPHLVTRYLIPDAEQLVNIQKNISYKLKIQNDSLTITDSIIIFYFIFSPFTNSFKLPTPYIKHYQNDTYPLYNLKIYPLRIL